MKSTPEDWRRYAFLTGYLARSPEEQLEMERIGTLLREDGIHPGWEEVPNAPPPDLSAFRYVKSPEEEQRERFLPERRRLREKYPGMLKLLGVKPDREVARLFGLSESGVQKLRTGCGISRTSKFRQVSPEEEKRILALDPRIELRKAGKMLGINRNLVAAVRRKHGVTNPNKGFQRGPSRAKIEEALRQGASHASIAKKLGVSRSTVSRVVCREFPHLLRRTPLRPRLLRWMQMRAEQAGERTFEPAKLAEITQCSVGVVHENLLQLQREGFVQLHVRLEYGGEPIRDLLWSDLVSPVLVQAWIRDSLGIEVPLEEIMMEDLSYRKTAYLKPGAL